jgi:hypothetical protein
MLSLLIWWVAMSMETLLLIRGVYRRAAGKYPFFFLYVGSVLMSDALLYYVYKAHPSSYSGLSRQTEVLNIVLGYGILLDIFANVLSRYPGAERLARVCGLALFSVILSAAFFYPLISPAAQNAHLRYSVVERDFLTVQAMFFFGILAIISYYHIEPGKNIRGMMAGYGLWLGTSVIVLGMGSYDAGSFNAIRVFAQPFSYLLSLLTWLFAFWNYAPVPSAAPVLATDADYELLAATTAGTLAKVRGHLGRASR